MLVHPERGACTAAVTGLPLGLSKLAPQFEEMEALPVFCIPCVIFWDVLFLLPILCVYPWHNWAAQCTSVSALELE